MRFLTSLGIAGALLGLALGEVGVDDSTAAATEDGYTLFESAHVRPLALSPDGNRLFAVNTPDNRLEILAVGDDGSLRPESSVVVGLEPVAVAVRETGEVWVVNHVSDSVSVVDVSGAVPFVQRTLLVGDEPRDIVFAGPGRRRAFITTAHRGQNSPVRADLTIPGTPRADVWVFDATDLGTALGGEPLTILELFGDTPRALAVSPDGGTVYAAVFRSGNRTTTLPTADFPKPAPTDDANGVGAPESGLIVQFDGRNWVDETGAIWDHRVGFSLPDLDVFEIEAGGRVPRRVRAIPGVGTTLLNMVVNPANGALYVSNMEALNQVRFAGMGDRGGTTLRGHFVDHRISVVTGGDVAAHDLNPHLNLARPEGSTSERRRSLAMPMGMAVGADGATLYLAAFGSNVVARLATAALERGDYRPRRRDRIELAAGGPTGMVLDEGRERLFVFTRYDNGISTVDTRRGRETAHITLPTPEPASIVEGRPFLYDATLTSGRGNGSCASCHLFGDNDALAWDLGDPDGSVRTVPNEYQSITPDLTRTWHPMKGPMTTQSMRGLPNHGPMHWRGDRTGENRRNGETLEEAAFMEFNEAFVAVQGRRRELPRQQMEAFTRFAMRLTYPPNPIRALDNSLTPAESAGRLAYNGLSSNADLEVCSSCHPVEPARGVFGTDGLMSSNGQPGERDFKIPHFRDQYQKVGMFTPSVRSSAFVGDQIRGFGFNHNGATSGAAVLAELPITDKEMAELRAYLFAFPSNMAPIVGQQVTFTGGNSRVAKRRLKLLVDRAEVTAPVAECDLVARAVVDGTPRGWVRQPDGTFRSDRTDESNWKQNQLTSLAKVDGQAVTFTCVPPGSGTRIGIDRDLDGVLDGDE